MNRFDFTPYRRSTVGFDRLFDMLENARGVTQGDNYPPFNIERTSETEYLVTIAVAGFKPDEIDITAQQNLLVVSARRRSTATTIAISCTSVLPTGISNGASSLRTMCSCAEPTSQMVF